jgi:hypothetical protein
MQTNCKKLFPIACRAAVFSFLMAGSAMLMQAQQTPSVAPAAKAPVFLAALAGPDAPNYAASYFGSSSSSSSSSSDALAAEDSPDSLGSAASAGLQPPPRRRYGQPSYAGSNTNPDGSPKWTGLGGFGLALPVGITHKYETPSWGFQAGFGRDWSKTFGVIFQFDYDHFGLQGSTLANQQYVENIYFENYFGETITGESLDGNNHVWSFTLNPTFTLPTEGTWGAYAVVGGGFYHKVTNFTLPSEECDPIYGECYTVNSNIDHYTSNAGGVNGGLGVTWKFSKFSNQRLYVEARYVVVFNQYRAGYTAANINNDTTNDTNIYPANSNRTAYIPIKFGIRF